MLDFAPFFFFFFFFSFLTLFCRFFGPKLRVGGDSWGIFFMPNGQAMVSALDDAAYRETLGRGTPLNLQDIDAFS